MQSQQLHKPEMSSSQHLLDAVRLGSFNALLPERLPSGLA
jgi:hypothetical protein